MTLISIRETPNWPDGFNATISFDGHGEYPITVGAPFSAEDEARLEAYFEQHMRLPSTDQVRAQEAAASVAAYGERLFEQVFADRQAFAEYKAALQAGVGRLSFAITGRPDFHRLHWEALKDPTLPRAFALDVPMARKNLAGDTMPDSQIGSQDKSTGILRWIDYSHSNLSPDAQGLLACLAPFTGVIFEPLLQQYSVYLRSRPVLAHLPLERWAEVLQEARDWGLIGPHDLPNFLRLQLIVPYFLRSEMHRPEQQEARRAVEAAFRQLYDQFGNQIAGLLDSKQAQEQQVGQVLARLEYENLMTALNLALGAQVSIQNPYLALTRYLDVTQDQRRGLELGATVLARLEQYPADRLAGKLGAEFVGVIDDIAGRQLLLRQFPAAEQSYQKALSIWLTNKSYTAGEIKQRSASIYHQLGRVAQEQREWAQAQAYYQQALQILAEYNDRYNQARTYHQLGMVVQERREWAQAQAYYQQALQILAEYNDRYGQAKTYHHLGMVAEEQREWAQAQAYYQQALQIFAEYNDRYNQSRTYHQLGYVAQEQREWAQAQACYQQALQILAEYNDRYSQARTYHQLGMVAEEQREWAQAQTYYQQALQILAEYNDRYSQASTWYQLGRVAQAQGEWAQARDSFLRALETFASYQDTHSQSITLGSLARLWRAGADTTLPVAVAAILGLTPEEVEEGLRSVLGD